ncbi:Hydroxysqualene synthase [Azospirillaceae bacterium]
MAEAVETPSGKSAQDENFPVGSRLLAAKLRPHVAAFYAFARAADDIGDNPALSSEEKLHRLDAFAQALITGAGDPTVFATSHRLRASLNTLDVTNRHALDLIAAFKQDAVKSRYADWNELMGYCALSASPVGRFLLDIHGESPTDYPPSDALCSVLQVLNHLQDCQKDHQTLDRVYLPQNWLRDYGSDVVDLPAARATPGMRAAIDRCLDGCDELLTQAESLPRRMRSRRLAMESMVILRLAKRLTARLRQSDPIAGRVALTRGDFLWCGLSGAFLGFTARRRPPTLTEEIRPA